METVGRSMVGQEAMDDRGHQWRISPAQAGLRLDRFLAQCFPDAGRAAIARLLAAGEARVNGRTARKGEMLSEGDLVCLRRAPGVVVALPDAQAAEAISVVYEDADLVVADKPPGMPSHPLRPGERGSLASALLARYPEMASVGYGAREPGIVHRLDTGTSGLVLAARTPAVFAALVGALRGGKIEKHYLARCQGAPLPPGTLSGHLRARGATVRMQDAPGDGTRPVSLEVLRSEDCDDGRSCRIWVSAHLAARHQVRAQLGHVGRPLLGDTRYGGPARADGGPHLLHAGLLGLTHPTTGRTISLEAAAPVAFWH